MKRKRLDLVFLFCAALARDSALAVDAGVIDLSKPVGESLPTISGVYWNFDDLPTDSQMVSDLSGNRYEGILEAGDGEAPVTVESVNRKGTSGFKTALRLATAATQAGGNGNPRVTANLPVDNALGMSGKNFTGGLWARLYSTEASGNQLVLLLDRGCYGLRAGEANAGHYTLFLHRRNGMWSVGFQTGDGLELCTVQSDPLADFDPTDWHHFGFNVHGSSDSEPSVVLWVNGKNVAERSLTVPITSGNPNSGVRRLTVGDRTTSGFRSLFNGAVDDVFVTEGVYEFQPPK